MRTTKPNTQHISTRYLSVVLVCALLLGVVGACDDGGSPPLGTFEAVVFGVAETERGLPITGATIQLTAHFEGFESSYFFGTVSTDTTGQFSNDLVLPFTPTISELTVEAKAPSGSDLADTTFTIEPFDLEFRTDPPFDSLRVDVVLPPAPSDEE